MPNARSIFLDIGFASLRSSPLCFWAIRVRLNITFIMSDPPMSAKIPRTLMPNVCDKFSRKMRNPKSSTETNTKIQ